MIHTLRVDKSSIAWIPADDIRAGDIIIIGCRRAAAEVARLMNSSQRYFKVESPPGKVVTILSIFDARNSWGDVKRVHCFPDIRNSRYKDLYNDFFYPRLT